MRRIAFFFIGAERSGMLEAVVRGELPDSALRGAHFFARHAEWQVETVSTHALESRLPRVIRACVPMSLVHLWFVPKLLSFDAVVASDAFLLGYIVSFLGRLSGKRGTKWIFVDINSSVLIRRHQHHVLRRLLLRRFWNSFAAIVCLSENQRLDMVCFGVREDLISVVHFGVDTVYFDGDPEARGEAIVSIGKDLGRDYQTLLRAAERIQGPVHIIASRKNISRGMRIPENVRLTYDLPLAGLKDVYRTARLVVVPSTPEEASEGADLSGQTVILEALAMGRPVIASDRAWLHEYFANDELLAIPPRDPEALAEAVARLQQDDALWRRMATKGKEKVKERYSTAHFAEGLMRVAEKELV